MNINKFTQSSMLAVQGCEKIADDSEIRRSSRSICLFPADTGWEPDSEADGKARDQKNC